MGFDVKPKEDVNDVSYVPKKDINNRVNYQNLKDPYMATGGKVGTGGHSRTASITEFRTGGNRSARDRQGVKNNLRSSGMGGSMKHQSMQNVYQNVNKSAKPKMGARRGQYSAVEAKKNVD